MLGRKPNAPSGSSSAEARLVHDFLEDRSEKSCSEVLKVFWRSIAAAVIKVLQRHGSADPDDVDDLIQDVYVRLCADKYRVLRQTRADRPAQLFAYVQAVATTTALDRLSAAATLRRGADARVLPLDDQVANEQNSVGVEEVLGRDVLIDQIDQHLQNGPARDRHIFWLYYHFGGATLYR